MVSKASEIRTERSNKREKLDFKLEDDVRKLFAQINTALLVGHSANSIRESLLPSAPEAVKPLLDLLLKCR